MRLVAIGDSKTVGWVCCYTTGGYRPTLTASLVATGGFEESSFIGVNASNGITTADSKAQIDAFLASVTDSDGAKVVLINLGTNDLPGIRAGTITQAAWVSDMGYILDAVHVKWPSALAYLMRVYRSDYTAEQDELDDTYIPAVLATRGAFAFVGPDERTFLPGNVTDTTHPNETGYALTAAEWQTAMGY